MEKVFDIALVFSSHEWVESLHRHCTNTGDLRIRSLVYDPVSMLTEEFDACIISDAHPALSEGLVHTLHESKRVVIGVCEETKEARAFLASIGVDAIFSAQLASEKLCTEVKNLLSNETDLEKEFQYEAIENSEYVNKNTKKTFSTSVIGTGGSGSTEIAIMLATRMTDSVIVDLDFEHPSIAPRLGLALEPNLLSAIEFAHTSNTELADQMQHFGSTAVITGATHPSFAQDIRNYELISFLLNLKSEFSNLVFDLGRISDYSQFFDHQQSTILDSDALILVGEPTPIGILRILETTALLSSILESLMIHPSIHVVLNKCPQTRDAVRDSVRELIHLDQISNVSALPFVKDYYVATWNNRIIQPRVWKKTLDSILLTLESTPRQKESVLS